MYVENSITSGQKRKYREIPVTQEVKYKNKKEGSMESLGKGKNIFLSQFPV